MQYDTVTLQRSNIIVRFDPGTSALFLPLFGAIPVRHVILGLSVSTVLAGKVTDDI